MRAKLIGRPRKNEAKDTKNLIIESSLRLFASHGFKGTSVRQIAQQVGVRESAIYTHFQSKDQILLHLIDIYGPQSVYEKLSLIPIEKILENPKSFFLEISNSFMKLWLKEESRCFAEIVQRECIGRSFGGVQIITAITRLETLISLIFLELQKKNFVRNDFTSELLAIEFLSAFSTIRFLFFPLDADDSQIKDGIELANKHIEFFINRNFLL